MRAQGTPNAHDSSPVRNSDKQQKPQQQQQQSTTQAKVPNSKAKEEEEVVHWPIFKVGPSKANERFWDRRVKLAKSQLRFQSSMLRLGKKKKTPKGYFYQVFSDGTLVYYKKEGDPTPKGSIQLTQVMMAHLGEQKTKKETILMVNIEKQEGLHVTIFEQKSSVTLQFFDAIKDFCVVSGFDKLYTQLEILGKGSFASVYKVKSLNSDQMFAAKTYFKETFEASQHKNKFVVLQVMIKNEIMALRKVIHPGVIRLYEVIQEKERLILIMEFVQGGDLYQLIKELKKIPEKNAAYMLKGVSEALNEMHINGFVHRDLKLENIMLKSKDSWEIKLVDFGFAEPINDKELVSKAGTPGYIPPEIFKLNPYTAKGDVFSIGVIFYSLISGISAFKGRNYQAVLEENRKCDISFDRSVWKDITGDCKSLLKKMLAPKAQHRYSCAEILEHDWIIENCCPDKRINSNSVAFQKQMTKQKSLYNPSDGSDNDFACEFSYRTNDLKSFYQRMNSQKTFRSQKSNISAHSKVRMSQKVIGNQRSVSSNNRQQFVSMKSQTMKASQHHKAVDRVGSGGKDANDMPPHKTYKSGYVSEQASFGDVLDHDSIAEDRLTHNTALFDDLTIPVYNLKFLTTAFNTFNRHKKARLAQK